MGYVQQKIMLILLQHKNISDWENCTICKQRILSPDVADAWFFEEVTVKKGQEVVLYR